MQQSSAAFIDKLTFCYLETYSLQRGAAYDRQQEQATQEYEQLKARRHRKNDLDREQQQRLAELEVLLGTVQYLINDQGNFHPSSEQTHTFSASSDEAQRLKKILQTELEEVLHFLCAPVYRDAIVFYDATGKMLEVLHVCLECQYLATGKATGLDADYKTYDALKRFFLDLGHAVEMPDHFIADDIARYKNKRK